MLPQGLNLRNQALFIFFAASCQKISQKELYAQLCMFIFFSLHEYMLIVTGFVSVNTDNGCNSYLLLFYLGRQESVVC